LSDPSRALDSNFGVLKRVIFPNYSATTVAKGYTVEEPKMLMWSRGRLGDHRDCQHRTGHGRRNERFSHE